jgi:endonuclease-3
MNEHTSESDSILPEKALLIHERLCREYNCPIAYFGDLDAMSELVSSLLSHRTKNADSHRAFQQLRAQYATWEEVRDAPTEDVQNAIAACTWPEQKAPRLQQILRQITQLRGALSLDFLGEMTVVEARAWLQQLPGVGPKTSAAVLAFSTLRRAALPVDSHHHRVAARLGLIPRILRRAVARRSGIAVAARWSAQQVYRQSRSTHAARAARLFLQQSACRRCVVLDFCAVRAETPSCTCRKGAP